MSQPPPRPLNSAREPLNGATEKQEGEEDDYMNMVFEEAKSVRETLTERQRRKQRESEIRGRPKSKSELALEGEQKREAALARSLIDAEAERTNKGLRMMKAMGFKPGQGLGRTPAEVEEKIDVTLEPIAVELKDNRAGIGHDNERKRKLIAAAGPENNKRQELDPEMYREQLRDEAEERRMEGAFYAAQKTCERLDMELNHGVAEEDLGRARAMPLKSINLLWRGAVRWRENWEAARRIKFDILQSLDTPRLPGVDRACELDEDDKVAMGVELPNLGEGSKGKVFEEDDGLAEMEGSAEVDEELEGFEEKSFAEKLQLITAYLRERHRYCFWCKYRYKDDAEMEEGCLGLDEDSHG